MQTVLYTGLKDSIYKQVKQAMPELDFMALNKDELSEQTLAGANAIILGSEAKDYLHIIQKVSGLDTLISIVILTDAAEFNQAKNDLKFTPFISRNTYCYPFHPSVIAELEKAIVQTTQRRRFQLMNASLKLDKPAKPAVLRIEQLGYFLDQAPIGAILVNKSKQIVALNLLAKSLFNWTSASDKKLPQINDLVSEEHADKLSALIETNNEIKNYELEVQNKFLEINISQASNEAGTIYFILLINDITERRIEDKRVRTILNTLPQMGWLTDTHGNVTYLTEGWYAYTGEPRNQSGNEWLDYIFKDDQAKVVEKWKDCLPTGKLFEQEARYKSHRGEYRWHLIRAVPIFNLQQHIDYWLGIATDIEDQKRVEKGLELEVEARTSELSEANSQLKKSNANLGEFAYIASHDLQEPLRKIRTFSSLLQMDLMDEAKIKNYVSKINASIERMSDLISGVLSHSNLSGSDKDFTEVDLQHVLETVTNDFDLLLTEKKGVIKSDPLPVIHAIKLQMQQLFSNLISNSLKYSSQEPILHIQSKLITDRLGFNHTLLPQKTFLELSFADNGIGFDQQNAQKIFNIFSRLHGQKEYSGTGIGLALCKKIVENHNGFIFASSELNRGAVFYVYLPVD